MKKRIYVCIALLLCMMHGSVYAQQNIAVKVAALPFSTFSSEEKSGLGTELAVKLLQQLSRNPLIVIPEFKDIQTVVGADEGGTITEARLKEIAKLLGANFLLLGSITKIKDELSADLQVYYNFPGDAYFKTYAEGTDIEAIINDLSRKIEQEIMDKAELVPPAQRPKVAVQQRPSIAEPARSTHDLVDYEKEISRELAAEERRQAVLPVATDRAPGSDELEESELTRTASAETKELSPAAPQISTRPGTGGDERSAAVPGLEKKKRGTDAFSFNQPVNINADSLEYDNKSNSATFRGNVVARQGDIVMFADTIDVLYGEKSGEQPDKGKLKQLSAVGNVKVIQGERIATGQKIVFYNDEQKIVATGNPRVWQGDNVIVGNKITVYLKEDRSVVEGSLQDRVSATIFPKQKKTQRK